MQNTDKMKGWKRLEEVWIPPVTEKGFREDVVIRKRIAPAEQKKLLHEAVPPASDGGTYKEVDDEATVLLMPEEEYDGEEATVLIQQVRMPKAYLIRKKDSEEILIDKDRFVLGKSKEADYVVRDNLTVSRKHALITLREDGYYVEDLGSSNFTWLNEEKITDQAVRMTGGAVLKLSTEEFEFQIR